MHADDLVRCRIWIHGHLCIDPVKRGRGEILTLMNLLFLIDRVKVNIPAMNPEGKYSRDEP